MSKSIHGSSEGVWVVRNNGYFYVGPLGKDDTRAMVRAAIQEVLLDDLSRFLSKTAISLVESGIKELPGGGFVYSIGTNWEFAQKICEFIAATPEERREILDSYSGGGVNFPEEGLTICNDRGIVVYKNNKPYSLDFSLRVAQEEREKLLKQIRKLDKLIAIKKNETVSV